ncbi:MAG: DUF1700 domain-containing protein [Roseburia sp.]|nr:DUF1700 domain-containing protein [Roseburia sp.]
MNKEEFLRQLEALLSGISEEERREALAFYRSYFEDAGESNEASIIAELESPQKVAESILKDMGIDGNGSGYNAFANRDEEYYKNVNQTIQNLNGAQKTKKNHGGMTGLTVALLAITSPIWLTLLLVILCVLLAVVAALFGVAVAVIAVMASLIFVGFVLIGCGTGLMFSGAPAVGIGLCGGGLIVLALGILAVLLVIWVFGVFLPWALKGIWNLCKKPFDKRKERVAA